MEFMALGIPVIVSRTKIDSYYHDDSMVKFFESENADQLAEANRSLQEAEAAVRRADRKSARRAAIRVQPVSRGSAGTCRPS